MEDDVPGTLFEEVPELNLIRDFWLKQKEENNGALPDRKSFNPVDFKAILPNIFIVDVNAEEKSFQVRLFGTKLIELFGADGTGWTQDTAADNLNAPEYRQVVRDRLNEVIAHCTKTEDIYFTKYPRARPGYKDQYAGVIAVPLTNGSGNVDQVLAVIYSIASSDEPTSPL